MRERAVRAGAGAGRYGDEAFGRSSWYGFVLRRPKDSFAAAAAVLATVAILINALFLQTGPHPAPIFANRAPAMATQPASRGAMLPRARPAEAAAPAPARPRTDLVADIQRELSKRGFYDGPADGVYGPKTDAAIRDFEQTAGLRPSTEPNEGLLQALQRSTVKVRTAPAAPRNDPIAELLAPNKRITAVQRALSDYGYGQIKPTGTYDPATRAAIERFERERKLPVTGQVSDRLVRELSGMTGRPLE